MDRAVEDRMGAHRPKEVRQLGADGLHLFEEVDPRHRSKPVVSGPMDQVHLVRQHQGHLIHLVQIVWNRYVAHIKQRPDRTACDLDPLGANEIVVHVQRPRSHRRFDRRPDIAVQQ